MNDVDYIIILLIIPLYGKIFYLYRIVEKIRGQLELLLRLLNGSRRY